MPVSSFFLFLLIFFELFYPRFLRNFIQQFMNLIFWLTVLSFLFGHPWLLFHIHYLERIKKLWFHLSKDGIFFFFLGFSNVYYCVYFDCLGVVIDCVQLIRNRRLSTPGKDVWLVEFTGCGYKRIWNFSWGAKRHVFGECFWLKAIELCRLLIIIKA